MECIQPSVHARMYMLYTCYTHHPILHTAMVDPSDGPMETWYQDVGCNTNMYSCNDNIGIQTMCITQWECILIMCIYPWIHGPSIHHDIIHGIMVSGIGCITNMYSCNAYHRYTDHVYNTMRMYSHYVCISMDPWSIHHPSWHHHRSIDPSVHPRNHGIRIVLDQPICIHVMNIIGIWYNVLPQWECILIMCVMLSYWWIYHHTMTRCHDDASHYHDMWMYHTYCIILCNTYTYERWYEYHCITM